MAGRAIIEGRSLQAVHGQAGVDSEYPEGDEVARKFGYRVTCAVPLMREGEAIGVIGIRRINADLLDEKQIAVIQSFAKQAAIAIGNVRQFNETKRLLKETEQRSSELAVINSIQQGMAAELDFQAIVDLVGDKLRELFRTGDMSIRWRDEKTDLVHSLYVYEHGKRLDLPPAPYKAESKLARALMAGKPVILRNQAAADAIGVKTTPGTDRSLSSVFVPIFVGDRLTASITLESFEREDAYGETEVHLLSAVAASMGLALRNAQLFNETKESLERQTATADILRVISNSPTSTQPVFDAILESGARLCEADLGLVVRYDAGKFWAVATLTPDRAFDVFMREPRRWSEKTGLGRVERTRQPVSIPDLLDDDAYREGDLGRLKSLELGGVRSWLGVPMLREGELIGAILVYRKDVRPFGDRQLALLRTFADQAVIAIENVRLFNETREALEQQTATAEVLQVISSSVADTAPVFDKILDSCQHLFATEQLGIFLAADDGQVHVGAWRGSALGAIVSTFARPLDETMTGQVIRERRNVHIADAAATPDALPRLRSVVALSGTLAAGTPMLWEDRGVGSVARAPAAVPFTDKELACSRLSPIKR